MIAELPVYDIPLDELEGVEDLTFAALHMDRETVMEDFDDVYEDTRERSLSTFECKGLEHVFPIARIDDASIELTSGAVLESPFLASVLSSADEVACYAAVVHGIDKLMKNPDNDVFDGMFFNAWGIGFTMACNRWMQKRIVERAAAAGRHVGRSWTPGEDKMDLSLQYALFDLIDPSRIGIALTETGMMSPLMSVSGFMGISNDPGIETVGSEEPSCH